MVVFVLGGWICENAIQFQLALGNGTKPGLESVGGGAAAQFLDAVNLITDATADGSAVIEGTGTTGSNGIPVTTEPSVLLTVSTLLESGSFLCVIGASFVGVDGE